MITQVIWTDVNNRELDTIYARVGDDEIREIQFIICRNDPPEKVAIPAGVSGQFRMIKSSGNFVVRDMVKTALEDGTVIFTVAVSDQMVNVQGTGYYDIRLSGGGYLYTASGRFIVDTPVISTSVLEDVSEVNGLVFPDDFLTIEDHVAIIDDDTVLTDSTWSSNKINEEIEAHTGGDVSKTVSGNPITFDDGASAPLVKCVTAITGYQSGTGTPSPDNIRPITAYTEGEIEVRGKNLVNSNDFTNGYLDDNGAFVSNNAYVTTDYTEVTSANSYTWSYHRSVLSVNIYGMSICWYDENKTFISKNKREGDTNIGDYSLTITAPNNAKYARCSATGTTYGENYQLELGSTATPYEPYTSTTHTTTYPSAIYRGSEDCVNGEVVTDWGMIASYAGETLPGEWISDRDEYAPGTTPTTGAQVAYELATPQTSSVTPTNIPIKSLSGYTHIESSTGDMEVEYITERFQPLIDSIKQLL